MESGKTRSPLSRGPYTTFDNNSRPYQSPLYPFAQLVGIVGMGYAFINNSPAPEMTLTVYSYTGVFLGITALYAFFWVKFVMRRGLLESESMEHALTD